MLLMYLQEDDPGELERLVRLCRDSVDLDWETRVEAYAASAEALLEQVKPGDTPALFLMDDGREALREAVARIRAMSQSHYLVLLLGAVGDALQVRPPYYRPAGFLLRPVDADALYPLLESIYRDYTATRADHGGVFPVKVRGTVYPIPYSRILCFESSGKKILARTNAQEYEFYGSLEEICRQAPSFFQRIHKGFCVNLEQVRSVNFKERLVTLSDDSAVPFSRTFKPELASALERSPSQQH